MRDAPTRSSPSWGNSMSAWWWQLRGRYHIIKTAWAFRGCVKYAARTIVWQPTTAGLHTIRSKFKKN